MRVTRGVTSERGKLKWSASASGGDAVALRAVAQHYYAKRSSFDDSFLSAQ